MIKYNYEVSVNENRAKLNKDIFLFRGNRNIHYYFSIKGARFAFEKEGDLIENANAIYAAVTVIKPNGVEVANAIAPVENGLIHLKVTEDLIDEEVEIGDFDLVFDLFDDSDGAVTIPKIKGQFHVQERPCTTSIGTLSGNVNVVNQAVVDLAIATQENEQLIVVDDDGKYVKTTWAKGNKISVERLNKMEEGIYNNSSQLKDIEGKQIILEKDDTSMNGIDDTTHDTLTTTDKTIIGGINEVNSQCKDIANLKNTGLTLTQIDLLKDVLYKMEFSTEELATQGKQAIDKLISSLKNTQSEDKVLISIYAVYNGGDVLVGTDINSLDIIVTGNYSDGSTVNITNFTVSGKIENGENTITVSYNDKTTTITVIGYVEGKNDIKGDVVFSDNYISKNKDYSFYQLTSEVGRRAYSIPITANKKYTLTWDLDNQYRNPNIGSIDYSTGILNKDNAIWLICTTSDMKNSTTERTTGTFESPTILTNLYTQQKGDDNNYYTSAEITWANDGYFSIDDSEIVPVHIYEG